MLKTDYETPVRELPNKITAWRRIADQESSLDRTLKDQEKTAAKLDKAMSKTKSTKTEQLHADLNQLTSSVASLSPMVYTTFQRLDEERLNTLKEVIVRWSTARADMAARDGERAEASVAKLLSWEPIAEVESVGHRIAQAGGGTPGGTPRSQAANHNAQPPGTPTRRLSMQTTGSATGDFTPRMSKVNASNSNVSATGTPSGGGGFSGFKSLLTRKATTANRQRSGSEAASTRSSRRPTGTSDVFESLDERPGEQGDGFAAQTGKPTQRREREPSTTQSLHVSLCAEFRPNYRARQLMPKASRSRLLIGTGTLGRTPMSLYPLQLRPMVPQLRMPALLYLLQSSREQSPLRQWWLKSSPTRPPRPTTARHLSLTWRSRPPPSRKATRPAKPL